MEKLIKSCKNFERSAQREMVNHLSPMLYSICLRYANKNHEATKDLVQDSLIKIFNNIHKCDATSELPFKGWCKRVAINVALGKIRKKTILTQEIDINQVRNQAQPVAISKLNVDDILKLLSKIPMQHRLVFNMAIIDGYKHNEIAEILNIQESSSRAFLSRARKALQTMINAEWGVSNKTKSI